MRQAVQWLYISTHTKKTPKKLEVLFISLMIWNKQASNDLYHVSSVKNQSRVSEYSARQKWTSKPSLHSHTQCSKLVNHNCIRKPVWKTSLANKLLLPSQLGSEAIRDFGPAGVAVVSHGEMVRSVLIQPTRITRHFCKWLTLLHEGKDMKGKDIVLFCLCF